MIDQLAETLNIQPKMVRFYIARLLGELALKRRFSKAEQKKIYNKCNSRKWPWNIVNNSFSPDTILYDKKIIYYNNILSEKISKHTILNHDYETEFFILGALGVLK